MASKSLGEGLFDSLPDGQLEQLGPELELAGHAGQLSQTVRQLIHHLGSLEGR
jgi:hypothetical protein